MFTALSIMIFTILLCLAICAYFFGHWIKKAALDLWHVTGERLHLHIPRWHAH
ncbi:MAG: hypothetical protein AABZ62_04825 [Planctomycetota bacterium]|uniref:hypothetical protein n=1 Tax=Candidatus Avalokitesvara rifleensis TaxID=3367620 RepID=UPI0027139669|nr:hypothetical protein [Candidatus Brocadiales bacterium]